MYYIPQITSNDCLFTAFKILLANVKKDEKYLYLQEDEKHGPYSLLEIIEKGKLFGVELFGFEANDKNQLKDCKNMSLILTIKRGNNSLHSVYVYKVTKNTVYYLDSDSGKVSMPFEKFIAMWDGKGLMTRTIKDVENEPSPVVLKIKRNYLSNLFQFLSAICFIFAMFFIDGESHIAIPTSLIVGGLIVEIVSKIIQVKDMKRFDKQTIGYLDSMKSKNYVEFIPRREKLKISLFNAKNNFVFYFLSCAFVIFVVLCNNPLNIACVLMPIVLAIFQSVVIGPLEKKKNLEIEDLEVKFSKEKNGQSANKTIAQIQKDSYRFVFAILVKNIIDTWLNKQ